MKAYSKEQIEKLMSEICERIAKGESLRSVLRDENMPDRVTFYKWLNEDKEHFNQYAHATQLRADYIFDEMLEIADTTIDGVVIETDDNGRTKEKKGDMLGHRRLQIDARKWILAKMNPKKYGDKTEIDHSSSDGSMSPTRIVGITFDPD
jgi:hypothetical protein